MSNSIIEAQSDYQACYPHELMKHSTLGRRWDSKIRNEGGKFLPRTFDIPQWVSDIHKKWGLGPP